MCLDFTRDLTCTYTLFLSTLFWIKLTLVFGHISNMGKEFDQLLLTSPQKETEESKRLHTNAVHGVN